VWLAELRELRIAFGPGTLESVGDEARRLGGRRVLLVTDRGIEGAGHVERAVRSLERSGASVEVLADVSENPSEAEVERGVQTARAHRTDLIVGLGGGSPLDCAKGINFVYTNGGRMEDYWGFGKAERPMLPSIGIPSTAGTGSEAQSYAIISRDSDQRKMACGDPEARFDHVILDPTLPQTAPRAVRAVTGLDALSHAVESYVTRARNPFSEVYAKEAWQRLESNFEKVVEPDGGSDEEWGEMLIGAHLGGAAIEVSMLGAAHACANPITARYGITHGTAVAIFVPTVVRFNGRGRAVAPLYDRLAGERGGAEAVATRFEELRNLAGQPGLLRQVGVQESELEALAKQAAEQWTGSFNPRPVGEKELLYLYQESW
jgi:alcohol dehydrogenase